MTTTKTRKPAAKPETAGFSLARNFAAALISEQPDRFGYLFGLGPVREATAEELAAYEARRDDPAFAALNALATAAQAGEDVSVLPVTVLDGGAAPEPEAPARTALEEAADPYEQHFGPVRRRDLLARWSPPAYAQEAAAAFVAAQEPPAFEPDLDAKWGGEVTEGGTAVIPAVSAETDLIDAVDADGES